MSSAKSSHHEWSSFIRECSTTWSQIVVDQLKDEFSSPDCLFIMVDVNEDKPSSETQELGIPTKSYIESVLSCHIAHLDIHKGCHDLFAQATHQVNAYFAQCLQEFVLKLSINAISTGAHVLIGKTYENIMIDVKVSNEKLYWRAVSILQKFSNKSLSECETQLLSSIYGRDYSQYSRNNLISEHIERATEERLVVPRALIMLITNCDYDEASKLLSESSNSVRGCIKKVKDSTR